MQSILTHRIQWAAIILEMKKNPTRFFSRGTSLSASDLYKLIGEVEAKPGIQELIAENHLSNPSDTWTSSIWLGLFDPEPYKTKSLLNPEFMRSNSYLWPDFYWQ